MNLLSLYSKVGPGSVTLPPEPVPFPPVDAETAVVADDPDAEDPLDAEAFVDEAEAVVVTVVVVVVVVFFVVVVVTLLGSLGLLLP